MQMCDMWSSPDKLYAEPRTPKGLNSPLNYMDANSSGAERFTSYAETSPESICKDEIGKITQRAYRVLFDLIYDTTLTQSSYFLLVLLLNGSSGM